MKVSWDDYSQYSIWKNTVKNVPNHQPDYTLIEYIQWIIRISLYQLSRRDAEPPKRGPNGDRGERGDAARGDEISWKDAKDMMVNSG